MTAAQGTREVINLVTGDVEYYDSSLSAEDALINAWMLGNRLVSSLHNAKDRNAARVKIIRGSISLGLGNYATKIDDSLE